MTFRIILVISYCHLVQVFSEGIDLSQQCSSSTSPTPFPSESGISEDSSRDENSTEFCPKSARCLNVLWTEFKPYSYQVDSTFWGIIPDSLDFLIYKCCHKCCKVNLTVNVSRQEITTGTIPPYIDIVLPYSAVRDTEVQGMDFVDIVDNPSVVYITKKEKVSAIPKRLILAIWMAWPVLLIALLLSLLSGVLLWFLELWHNSDQFPRSFFKGSWEGFWWAFVSMTTVGYGDRAPKSILGRGFAVLWITIGICICSVFTATLTTSLNTITLEEKKTLARSKVGAIRSSLEAYAGVTNKAKVINYNTTKELWHAIYSDDVDGILLDSFFSATPEISKIIEKNSYKISQTVDVKERYYGILVRDMNLTECFRKEIRYEREWYQSDYIHGIITEKIEANSKPQQNEAATRSDSIFKPTSDVFYPALFVCIALIVVMLIAGLSWEFVFMDKCYKHSETGSSLSMKANATNLEQLEREMIADIQNMFSALRAQRDLDIARPMKVGDVELKVKRNGSQFGVAQQSTQQQKFP